MPVVPGRRERPDRDLVEALRAELAAIEPTRACCRAALRAGLGDAAEGHARSAVVARLAVRLEEVDATRFDWTGAADHCRMSWLRGRFLWRGSLSLAEGRMHLELVVAPEEAPDVAERVAGIGAPAGWRLRRGRGVVTWKSIEGVLTLLRRMGASASVLELETRLVTRQLQGHLNRVLNAEGANLTRAVRASHRQSIAIATLAGGGSLSELSPFDQRVARARVDAPEATLSELAAELGVTRSRVQRSLVRIERVARDDARDTPGDGRPDGSGDDRGDARPRGTRPRAGFGHSPG
jgi:DNA-binding transcriptional regulator WhiA